LVFPRLPEIQATDSWVGEPGAKSITGSWDEDGDDIICRYIVGEVEVVVRALR
jgi:hypothetical protein